MNKAYYESIELGQSIPLNNPHAFSVSMPTIKNVMEYERKEGTGHDLIKSAYPRMVVHPYVVKILALATKELKLENQFCFLLPNLESAQLLIRLSQTSPKIHHFKNYIIVSFLENKYESIEAFSSLLRHSGYMIFSREAADLLGQMGEAPKPFPEELHKQGPEDLILSVLQKAYVCQKIVLSNCGMSAIFAAILALEESQGRGVFILFGWAYTDTIEILKKYVKELIVIENTRDLDFLNQVLKEQGNNVKALISETVSNPLITVPPIPQLYELSKKYDFPLLVDNTFATPWTVDIGNSCDLIFESLTKFASGKGDLMAGALVIPDHSRLDLKLINKMEQYVLPLYEKDAQRLAMNIQAYETRILQACENTKVIEKYLLGSQHIKKVFTVNSLDNCENWKSINKFQLTCPLLSFEVMDEMDDFYDEVLIPKGPSLGTEFPLLMPYTLLAHFDQTQTAEGRDHLNKLGLSPHLLRLSVGTDDPQFVIDAFEKVFA